MNAALTALQQRLGHRFSQPELLTRAVTHRSFGADHNERLEFLGDAVLSLAVSSLLYQRFADSDEGDLTRIRAHLVREDSLHRLALGLDLPAVLRISDGEAKGGGAQRPSILADAMEALIGATYVDGGYDAALDLVGRLFAEVMSSAGTGAADPWGKDAKTALQEWLQAPFGRAHLPHHRNTGAGPRADLRGRVRGACSEPVQKRRRPLAPRCRARCRPSIA